MWIVTEEGRAVNLDKCESISVGRPYRGDGQDAMQVFALFPEIDPESSISNYYTLAEVGSKEIGERVVEEIMRSMNRDRRVIRIGDVLEGGSSNPW